MSVHVLIEHIVHVHVYACTCKCLCPYISILWPLELVEQLRSKHSIEILPQTITHFLDLPRADDRHTHRRREYVHMNKYI